MDYTRIQIESIGIGLSNIYDLDLTKDNFIRTHLAVGELYNDSHNVSLDTNRLNHIHNLVVTNKAVGVNTSRNKLLSLSNKSLIVEGNIHCLGSITAESILLDNINILTLSSDIKNFNQILNRLSSHLLFYSVKDYLQDNIYTTQNITIGTENNANNNTNPLKISRHCNNNISNIQFVIQNNDGTNNIPTRFSCGIIGGVNNSPFHMITSSNMPLHFNISKTYSEIDNLYIVDNDRVNTPNYATYQMPSLAFDISGSVLINLDKIPNRITYDKYLYQEGSGISISSIIEYPNLYVKGSLYSDNIIIYDYISRTPKSLDSLYIRQGAAGGLTLDANQIRGGNFNNTEFIFNSNVYIGTNTNNYKLKIYGNSEITNNLNVNNLLTSKNINITNDLIVTGNGICDFNNTCYFSGAANFNSLNCIENITTKSITVTDTIIYKGSNISLLGINPPLNPSGIVSSIMDDMTLANYINVGGQTTGITDGNYNSDIINIYKHRNTQKNQYELYLHDKTITPYGSAAYIGHTKLNTLENEIDNSLVFLTQYNTTWNNIYFYAGKNKLKINDTPPNFGIFENNKIGINTIRPIKTLDINGDMITSNYYIRKNNIEYECDMIIKKNNYNYISDLNINTETEINRKQLNVNGGINSYDGYYEGNNKLCSIKYLNSSNAIIENVNIGLGVQFEDPNITIPLKIQNTNINNKKINNSVISFYRSSDNSRYSGIEFCDDSTNINYVSKNKWYIYKNHISDDINYAGPLQFGYIKNGYKPKKSCINLYYDNDKYYIDINNPITYGSSSDFNKNKEDLRITGNVKITGDIDIDGSINIKGNYKFNDNNILFSPNPVESIINKIYSLGNNVYYFDTILSPNHPKKISFTNSNLAYNTYMNILDDKNNYNIELNKKYSTSNYIISSNNYELTNILSNDIDYYNNDIIINSNNTINYFSYINNFTSNINDSYSSNDELFRYYTNYMSPFSDYLGEPLNINSNILLFNLSNNYNYSYSNFILSSNIYDIVNDVYLTTRNSSNISLNLINMTIDNVILAANVSNQMKMDYANIIYNADINIITKYGYSNRFYSSNIYSNTLIYYNNVSNINNIIIHSTNLTNSIISMANTSKSLLFDEYTFASNFYINWKDRTSNIADYGIIIQNNKDISSNNEHNLDILKNNINTYSNLYKNISTIINPTRTTINNTSNLLITNINNTNNIYQSLTIPIKSYLDSAYFNSNIAYNNYQLISNIAKDYNLHIGNINNINLNSNIIIKNTIKTSNLKIDINENNNSNYYLYDTFFYTILSCPFIDLYSNASNNSNYSLLTYNISSNIYNDINSIHNYFDNYLPIANNYKILTNTYLENSLNVYNNLLDIYNKQSYLVDIANIIRTGNSNRLIASNIYQSSSNYYNNIFNIKSISSNLRLISIDDMISSSNTYINCSYLYNTNNINTNVIKTNLLINNNIYASNILIYISNIYNNLLDNYPNIYSEFNNNNNYNITTNSNLCLNNIVLTTRIANGINTDINTYLAKSLINNTNASNIDLQISSFNPDYSSNLLYYVNDDEIGSGINATISYISNLKLQLDNFKIDILNICASYAYLFELDIELNNDYTSLISNITYNINLIREIEIEIINIFGYINEKEILLELILHITNKYINFINNSYNLSNSLTIFVEEISNYIGIYINTSLSLIPLLNNMIEFTNYHLDLTWNNISQQIVLFASLSYSVNSSIKSSTAISTEGKNTDVLIIGNNIKIYPKQSLIIGHDNNYSKWLESINDVNNYSAAYIYNNTYDGCASSFNCRTKTFISSGTGLLSLKSSALIDLNLIDTLIKPDGTDGFNAAIIDGVSLKLSHIFHRDDFNIITSTINNSLFEITRKKLDSKPYFSCYTTSNDINIMNIGGGNFYDTANNCIIEDTIVHINDDTAYNLLKLTNNSTNPILVGFTQNNNNNNWQLSVSNNFSYKYNSQNILSITSNGVAINSSINENATIFINSFNNIPALELKNNYISSSPLLVNNNIIVNNKLDVKYNESGIIYSNLDTNIDYDISTTNFYYSSNILFDDIIYRFNNVIVNYNNINDNLIFPFHTATNTIDLMPILEFNDPNIIYNYESTINYTTETYTINGNTINYRIPIIANNKPIVNIITTDETITGIANKTNEYYVENPTVSKVLLTSFNVGTLLQGEDAGKILITYDFAGLEIKNFIIYNKYISFALPSLNITLTNYKYNIIRLNNIVPVSLYNGNYINTITKTKINETIIINNNIDYLKPFTGITSNLKTYTENKLKIYSLKLNNVIYNIPINITINDNYYKYENCELLVEYVKTTAKKPLIKQTNIYNNAHNIYSFTDDYEIYLNNTKLLNINSHGTLKTTGNIETNNIYLKGDIYNSDGSSLYDNILSLINNISSSTNFELNTRNIILNPAVGFRDSYKGGILINGNNINNKNNNLFQINNFPDNDNFITLNSCTSKSFIHFNNKITKNMGGINLDYNSIYRIGLTNETFGIWKNNLNEYDKNLFIDTNITTNYINALEINKNISDNKFILNFNGTISSTSDQRLNADIMVIDNALNKLCTLRGITYKNIGSIAPVKRQTGLLAQEVNEVLPEAVSINNDGYYNIAYGNLAGLIIESIKELKTEINSIKSRLDMI
jgi:hypothetical protein